MREKKPYLQGDEEIVIGGDDIVYLVSAIGELLAQLSSVKMSKTKRTDINVRFVALFLGVVKLLPRNSRKRALKDFQELMGIDYTPPWA